VQIQAGANNSQLNNFEITSFADSLVYFASREKTNRYWPFPEGRDLDQMVHDFEVLIPGIQNSINNFGMDKDESYALLKHFSNPVAEMLKEIFKGDKNETKN